MIITYRGEKVKARIFRGYAYYKWRGTMLNSFAAIRAIIDRHLYN